MRSVYICLNKWSVDCRLKLVLRFLLNINHPFNSTIISTLHPHFRIFSMTIVFCITPFLWRPFLWRQKQITRAWIGNCILHSIQLIIAPMMTTSKGNIFGHKGQWRGTLMFPLICAWINGCANNREAGDLKRHRAHYDVIGLNTIDNNYGFTITEEHFMRLKAVHSFIGALFVLKFTSTTATLQIV